MKNEIKEILDNLVVNETTGMCYLSIKLTKQIKDCITNLQEENERLKEELQQEKKDFKEANDYCFELKDYKSRNEKAIQYIKEHSSISNDYTNYWITTESIDLLKILKGDKDE